MKKFWAALAVATWCVPAAFAQSGVNDLLEGKLVNPKVGQWAWYDLIDTTSGKRFVVRQAIVGSEKVGRDTGYWVEFEIVPEVGYRGIFKMLLTGPASDPKNIHRVIRKQGIDPPEEIPKSEMRAEPPNEPRPKRESLGMDEIVTPTGVIRCERTRLVKGGETIELWSNDDVPPTGIVKFRSPQGEMSLRSFGTGGNDANSVLGATAAQPPSQPEVHVDTTAESSPQANDGAGKSDKEKKSFFGRKRESK